MNRFKFHNPHIIIIINGPNPHIVDVLHKTIFVWKNGFRPKKINFYIVILMKLGPKYVSEDSKYYFFVKRFFQNL